MNSDDKVALKEFMRGATFTIGIVGLFILIVALISNWGEEPSKSQPNFEVVDKYKNCDLVRWSDSGLAEYKYFLYCPK